MPAHDAEADAALAHRGVFGALHGIGRFGDKVRQDVVEESHDILDDHRVVFPLIEGFKVERGQAAYGGAFIAQMVFSGRQCDFRAEIRHLDVQTCHLVVVGNAVIHMVDINNVRLPGFNTGGQQSDPEIAGADFIDNRTIFGRFQREFLVALDGMHEGIVDQYAVMEVQRLAVRVAAGGAAQFDEFLDLRVPDRQVNRRRAAPQRALGNR